MLKITDSESKAETHFFASENGMIIGSVQMGTTQWGVDRTTSETRFFITDEDAIDYLKDKCRELWGRQDLDFVYENNSPIIRLASAMPKRRM